MVTTDENRDEPDQIFQLNLRNPINATLLDGSVEVTITDKDAMPTLQFVATSSSSLESVGSSSLAVSLSHPCEYTVAADYAVTGGSATNGNVDYNLTAGTVSFSPLEVNKNITLAVTEDWIFEGNETVEVTLSNPAQSVMGLNNPHTLTITDNETQPDLQFKVVSSSVGEAETTHNVLVETS